MAAAAVDPDVSDKKRAIVFITMHGELDGNDTQIYTGKMKIRKINTVDAGVCNILSDATANAIINYFRERTRTLYKTSLEQAEEYLTRRIAEMDPVYQAASKKNTNLENFSSATNYVKEDLGEYLYTVERHYQSHEIRGEFLNKNYILVPGEKILLRNKRNNNIYLMGSDGRDEDLAEIIPKIRYWRNKLKSGDYLEIKTSELLEYIEELGYSECIIADLSCMVDTDNPDADGRATRYFASTIRKSGVAHGLTRRRRKSRKNIQTKRKRRGKNRRNKYKNK